MGSLRAYLRQHHVGLIAILLILSGGTAYAVTAPKNSVVSSSIKNGAVKTTDIKDGTIRGKDIADGTITASDLAGNATTETRLYEYGSGGDPVVWEDPTIGKVTMTLSCSPGFSVNSFASLQVSPGRVGVYGVEDINRSGETATLVGAATVSRDTPAQPVGGAGFGGGEFGFGQLVFHYDTPTKDVFIDIRISLCSARGSITITHKGPDTTPPPRSAPGQKKNSCVATGAAYCGKQRPV
jgi:hypothetical protein